MKKKHPEQQRTSPREAMEAFATVTSSPQLGIVGHDQAFCVVVDVSRTGIRLRTPQPPIEGQNVSVSVALGEEVHAIAARVAWVAELATGYDVGLEYQLDPGPVTDFLEAVKASLIARPVTCARRQAWATGI